MRAEYPARAEAGSAPTWYEAEAMERVSDKARGIPGILARAAHADGPVGGGTWARSEGGP